MINLFGGGAVKTEDVSSLAGEQRRNVFAAPWSISAIANPFFRLRQEWSRYRGSPADANKP